jgi:hypothetical protein
MLMNNRSKKMTTISLAAFTVIVFFFSAVFPVGFAVKAQADTANTSEYIIDNSDPGFSSSGTWVSSNSVTGYYGSDYLRDGTTGADTTDTWAKWTPNIQVAGYYNIYMLWTASSNRPAAAPLDIQYDGGTDSSQTVNQQTNNGTWVLIGKYHLSQGTNNYVKILATCPGYTIADAVKFEYVDPNANLVPNGGFESGLWSTRVGASIDTTVVHSGNQSASMTGNTAEQYLGTGLIPVKSNGIYDLSAWIKTSGISTSDAVSVNALMVDANDNAIGWCNTEKLIKTGGTQDWTKYTAELSSFAAGTAYIKIFVRLDGNVTGTVWFDDIAVNLSDNMLANGGFESGLWSTRAGASIDTTVKHSGNQSASMTGNAAEQYLGTGLIPVKSNEVYELSAWIKTANISKSDGVSVNALMVDTNDKALGWYNNTMKLIKTGGTQDWTKYTAELSNFAAGTAYIKIFVREDGNITGTAWFDDIAFKLKDFIIGVNGPTGNIFTSSEPTELNLTMTNSAIQDKYVHVDYSVKDYNNNTITTGNFDADVVAGVPFNKELDFSSIGGYEVYTLEVNVTGDNGNISVDEDFPFSRVLASGGSTQDGIYGTSTHLLGATGGTLDKYLSLAAQAGIKWVRDDAHWSVAETVKGQISIPASWDLYADTALSKGINPLFIIDYGNPLYDGGKAPYTDEGIAAYANYAGKLAEHFKGKVDHFEIWNEWNIGSGNPDHLPPEAYEKVLQAAYTAIKAANPNAVVIGCTTSGADAEWIKRVLAAGGYNYMDTVSIHPYTYPTNPDDGGFIANLKTINGLFNGYGPAKPIWVTEIGWPTSDANSGGVSELMSGAYAVRTYTLALSSGLADKVFWYDFKNDGISQTNPEANFGLVRWDGESVPWSAKENYVALSAFTSKISGADFVKAYTVGDQVQAYRFHRNSDGKDVLVLWSKNDSKNLLLNLGTSNAVSYDLFGNSSNMTAAADGTITLPVSVVPVYLEGNFSQDIEITDPYNIQVVPQLEKTSQGNQWNVNINISNNLNTELSGKVQILDSSPWDNGSEEKPFTVAANNSATVSYEFPGNPEEKLYDLKIQITSDNGTSAVVDRRISFLAAQKAYKAPVIDGVISQDEWAEAMPISIDQASQVHMSNWGGVNDLSGNGYIKWDKDNFYFAVAVKDNIHVQNGTGGDIWQGDGIQFAIDPGRKSGLSGLGYNEIGVALNQNTSSVIKWRWTAAVGVADLNNAQCVVKRDDSSGTTTYEMAIPWADLLPDGITAAPGSDFGFSMLINDNDGSGRRGWMEYMSGIGGAKDPNAFGDLILADMPTLDSVTPSADKTAIKPGETASLSVYGAMSDGSQADLSVTQIVYTSDNEQVAKVDGSGNVTAIGEGIANVKASVTLYGITKENSIQIIVDGTTPVTTAKVDGTEKNGWYSSDAAVTLSATDNPSGVDKTEYRIGDSGNWLIYTGPFAVTQEGTTIVQYRSTDKAGNVEAAKQQTVQVDKTPPSFSLLINGRVLQEGESFDDDLPLTFQAGDTLSGVANAQISVSDSVFGSVQGVIPPSQTGLDLDLAGKVGSHTATISVEDMAGNKLEHNSMFTITTSIDSMRHLLDRFVKAGELSRPLTDQLTYNLDQAQQQLDIGRLDQAAKQMEDFIQHLNNEALESHISEKVMGILETDAQALVKMWTGENR